MYFFQIIDGHPGVDLGGQGLMAEQFLESSYVGFVLQHGCGIGMTNGMGRDVLREFVTPVM